MNVVAANRDTSKLAFRAWCCLLVLYACVFSPAVWSQESDQKFSVYKSDRSLFGTYDTQEQAEAAIRTIPGPSYAPDIYQHVREIWHQEPSQDGQTMIAYWMGRNETVLQYSSIDGKWHYSEQEAVDAGIAAMNLGYSPPCPSASLTAVDDWTQLPGTDWEQKHYSGSSFNRDCEIRESVYQFIRFPVCVNHTSWDRQLNACVSTTFVAYIKTRPSQCEGSQKGTDAKPAVKTGLVGNPCDAKTGEKFESESDFDLGWIDLTRSYHSGVANTSGGFGLGWTDTHRAQLAITSSVIGLIEGSGYTSPFREVGSEFHATNGSGERIVADGDHWKLYRQGAVYTFDERGRILSRVNGDGSGLVYVYDDYGRVDAVASLQGRSIEFQYADNSGEALITGVSSAGVPLATYTYDAGRLKTVTYPDGKTRTYHYEDARFARHLTGITAEDGQRYSTFAYDDKGRAISSQHDGGADGVALSYSASGSVVTDALGEQTTYVMTDAGGGSPKVASVTNSAGSETYTYYDASVDYRRRLDTVTDRNGTQTKHTYAEATDPVTGEPATTHTITEAVGLPEQRITTEVRDLASNRLLSTTVGDRETRYAYNSRLQPATMTVKDLTLGQTRVTTFAYCEAADVSAPGSTCPIEGLPKSVDGPRTDVADVITYSYYPNDEATCATAPATCSYRKGDLWKTTNALGQVTETLAYDGTGRPRSIKDPNGVVTDLQYHARGWLLARKVRGTDNTSEADDRITRLEYWPTGLVKKVTQPAGSFTSFTYDAAQRLTDVTDRAGNTIHYTLDDAGNRLQEDTRDPGGALKRTLSRIYNELSQLETLADAQGNPTDFTYDANGNPDTTTDALSHIADQDHDPLNRLKRTLQDVSGIGAETKLGYDALDNPTQVTDPKGLSTDYAYNGFGDLTQLTSPDTGVTTYTYDSAGNRQTQTDARGKQATYAYDALNRLSGVTYALTSINVTYTYDVNQGVCPTNERFSVGRLTRMQDGSGTTQYCYNRFGNLLRKVQTTAGKAFTVRYSYNKSGQLQTVTYPDATRVDYVRNIIGQVTEVGVTPSGGAREILLTDAGWLPFGQSTGWTYGNGRQLQRSFDQDYRPASILDERTGGLDLGFGFDPVGNLDTLTTATNTAPLASFDYDALNRFTHFRDGPTQTAIETYAYDKTGNRTSLTNSTGTQAYTYPADSHHMTKVGTVSRQYSVAGSNWSIGGTARQFSYDDSGRMSQAKRNGAVVMNYRYNGRGERVRRYLGTVNTFTVYDETGHWLGDYDNNGAPLQQAIWLDDLPVGLLAGSTQQLHYVEPDHLGTPRAVIDPVRDVAVWKWDVKSEAFGNSPPQQDPDGDSTAFVFDMRFPGQRYDSATGLNYNYFRDYDPVTGRYVESDPIGLEGGISTYSYVSGSPIIYIDPLGLRNWPKTFVSVGNGLNAGRLYISGVIKLGAGTGAVASGVGAPLGAATAAHGAYNVSGAQKAWGRATKQWSEAQCEDSSNYSIADTLKTFSGLLPYGDQSDDPNEPYWDAVIGHEIQNASQDPMEFLRELGTLSP